MGKGLVWVKTWVDIESLLKDCPKSTWHRIPIDEEKELYHKTLDIPMGAEYPKETDDFEITNVMYNNIVTAIEENKDKQMYVRIYPEIALGHDGLKKHAYLRLQFIDKVTA
jgi:hypothetical protein